MKLIISLSQVTQNMPFVQCALTQTELSSPGQKQSIKKTDLHKITEHTMKSYTH